MTMLEYRHNSVGHEVQNCCCNTGIATWPQSKQEQGKGREMDTGMLLLTGFSVISEVDLQIILSPQYLST